MNKDAYYFPHDSNAKDDPKCVMLIENLGLEGYGIYWVLVETLRDQPGYAYPRSLLPALARRYNTSVEMMGSVVLDYGLFETTEDGMFFSHSLINRMARIDDRRRVLSEAGRRGNEKRWGASSASGGDKVAVGGQSQVKKTKPHQSKVNAHDVGGAHVIPHSGDDVTEDCSNGWQEDMDDVDGGAPVRTKTRSRRQKYSDGAGVRFRKPAVGEVAAYCAERANGIDPAAFHDFYESKGWMVGSNRMKDWRAAVRTWEQKNKPKLPEQPVYKVLAV